MNSAKSGFLMFALAFGLLMFAPVFTPYSDSVDCGGCITNYNDGVRCGYAGDLLRCSNCPIRDYDRSSECDYDRNAVRCDTCMSEFHCDLYGCAWIR